MWAGGWASAQLSKPLFEAPLSSSYKLVAVSTTNAKSAVASAKKHSEIIGTTVKAYHGSVDAIANDPEVDLVAISVKAPDHREAVLSAIKAGKDVFVEWPAGAGLAQTQEIAEEAQKKGVKVFIGTQSRQSLVVSKLKSIIDSGKLGRILSTTVSATCPRENHFWGPTILASALYIADPKGGASYLDIAIGHFLAAFLHVLGPISSLSATTATQLPNPQAVDAAGNPTGKTVNQQNPNQIAASGTLANGATLGFHFRSGIRAQASQTVKPLVWTIDFENGSVRVENDHPAGGFINIFEPKLFVDGEEIKPENPDNSTNLQRAWAEYAKDGNYPTIQDGVQIKRVVDAVLRSAASGQRVDL
ncbi:hypothetical protein AX16_005668 [Volvariella volvacea WC 439]|nr:hypothetical protein AX16_005668 [Volvariella volvacea WC 439]